MPTSERAVHIPTVSDPLEGNLAIPEGAEGIVVFAHGSGGSRHSPRNRSLANELQNGGIATLLMDLLTEEEEAQDKRKGQFRFNIDLLAQRVIEAVDWLWDQEDTHSLNIGAFGSSTGAAAALIAAANRPNEIRAVVSRGGRPDLARGALSMITSPTLMIVGEKDESVLQVNQKAAARMTAKVAVEIIPGATYRFQEPGAMEKTARLAYQWFRRFLFEKAS
ncbi:MAG: alpha/beta family hydrolase [Desulfobacterales bacterium]